jgi:DNA-binding NtrC family response regulator
VNNVHQLRNVLIIEDEPSMRNVICVLLAGLGCAGDIAHDGRQALAMIEKESFDAVLLDLRCFAPIWWEGFWSSPAKSPTPKLWR